LNAELSVQNLIDFRRVVGNFITVLLYTLHSAHSVLGYQAETFTGTPDYYPFSDEILNFYLWLNPFNEIHEPAIYYTDKARIGIGSYQNYWTILAN